MDMRLPSRRVGAPVVAVEPHVGAGLADTRHDGLRGLRLVGARQSLLEGLERVLRRVDGREHGLVAGVDDVEERHDRPPARRLLSQVVEHQDLAAQVPVELPLGGLPRAVGVLHVRENPQRRGHHHSPPRQRERGGYRRGVVGLAVMENFP